MQFPEPDTAVVDALLEEQKQCAEILKADWDNQCLRRIYCRTNYAMAEACIAYTAAFTHAFVEKMIRPVAAMLQAAELDLDVAILQDVVPEHETLLLIEKRAQLNQDGTVSLRDEYGSFVPRLNLCMRMLDRVFGVQIYHEYITSPCRSKLINGHKIRNRITHPKTAESLNVKESDLEQIVEGCQWLLDFMGQCFSKVGTALVENGASLDRMMDSIPKDLMASIQENMNRMTEQLSRGDF